MLLKKGLILVPAAIFAIALSNNNTLYAQSATATKDRIKEIKIVEDINIEKLVRNENDIVELANISFSNYTRNTDVTARSMETERDKTTTNNNTETENTNNEEEQNSDVISAENIKQKVNISRNMDLTKRTGLTKAEFKELVKHVSQDTSKFFYNNSDLIYDLCEKYQINEIFFCGLISAESGWNIVSNHRKTHNYISLMSGGKLIPYSSTSEGLNVAARTLHNNYLTPGGKFYGGKTLAGVQKKFCPSGSWISLVYGRMSQMASAANKIK